MTDAYQRWWDVLEQVRHEWESLNQSERFAGEHLKWHGVKGAQTTVRQRWLGGQLNVDALVVDPGGFCGFFRRYETDVNALVHDLYSLAQFRSEDAYETGINRVISDGQNGRQHANDAKTPHYRLWLLHLFACVREEALEELLSLLSSLGLMKDIGLSVLIETRETAEKGYPVEDVDRFLAPLLLRLRRWSRENRLEEERSQLYERIEKIYINAGERTEDTSLRAFLREKVWHEIRALFQASSDRASTPRRLITLKSPWIRRFAGDQRDLPFAPVVLLHGPNGSGKSSLLELIELSLTGTIRRIEGISKSRRGSPPNPLYRALLTPVTEADSGDLSRFNTLVYEPHIPLEDAREGGWSIRSFHLAQGELGRFIHMTSDDRFQWMAEVLEVPLDAAKARCKEISDHARECARPDWNLLTDTAVMRGDLLGTAKGRIGELLREGVQRLENVEDRLSTLTDESDAHVVVWSRELSELRAPVAVVLDRLRTIADEIPRRLEKHVQRDEGAMYFHDVTNALENVEYEVKGLGRRLLEKRAQWQHELRQVKPVVDSARKLLKHVSKSSSQDDLAAATSELDVDAGRKELEQELEHQRLNLSCIRAYKEVASAGVAFVRRAEEFLGKVAELESFPIDFQPALDELTSGRSNVFNEKIRLFCEIAQLVALEGDWFEAEESYWGNLEREINGKIDQLIQRLSDRQADLPVVKWMRATSEHLPALRQFLLRLEAGELADEIEREPLNSDALSRVVYLYESCEGILEALGGIDRELGSIALSNLTNILRCWYYSDGQMEEWGLGTLLLLIRESEAARREMETAVADWTKTLVRTEIGELWREIASALTVHAWNYPLAALSSEENSPRVEITASFPGRDKMLPAVGVFNMGEINILGLSWFLVAYLLLGRKRCNTMILDDPFQSLDDANLSTLIRVFLEIVRIGEIEQILLAVHQEGIVDYFLHELTVDGVTSAPRYENWDATDSMVEWRVRMTGRYRSEVVPVRHRLRIGVRPEPFDVEGTGVLFDAFADQAYQAEHARK